MIRIYYTDINWYSEKDYKLMEVMAGPERLRCAEKYLQRDDRRRCLAAGMLLSYSLYDLHKEIIIPETVSDELGKPYVKKPKDFHYSISHGGSRVMIAVSAYKIGADIEEIKEHKEILSNPDGLFSEREIAYLKGGSGQKPEERFIQFWTVKESYMKQKGAGLFKDLASFSVVDPAGEGFIGGVISKKVFDDYYMSVFSEEENEITEIEVTKEDHGRFAEKYGEAVGGFWVNGVK